MLGFWLFKLFFMTADWTIPQLHFSLMTDIIALCDSFETVLTVIQNNISENLQQITDCD
jgi:hypothetical protein